MRARACIYIYIIYIIHIYIHIYILRVYEIIAQQTCSTDCEVNYFLIDRISPRIRQMLFSFRILPRSQSADVNNRCCRPTIKRDCITVYVIACRCEKHLFKRRSGQCFPVTLLSQVLITHKKYTLHSGNCYFFK